MRKESFDIRILELRIKKGFTLVLARNILLLSYFCS